MACQIEGNANRHRVFPVGIKVRHLRRAIRLGDPCIDGSDAFTLQTDPHWHQRCACFQRQARRPRVRPAQTTCQRTQRPFRENRYGFIRQQQPFSRLKRRPPLPTTTGICPAQWR